MTEVAGADALLIGRDLFFASKVTGTAAALGYRVELETELSRALSKAARPGWRCVFVDLAMPGLVLAELAAALPAEDRPRVVAFGAHVDTARLDEARAAGCDEVMPRSRFSATLTDILRRNL